MLKPNNKFYNILLLAALVFQCTNCALGAYETYRAKTVIDKNTPQAQEKDVDYFAENEIAPISDNNLSSFVVNKLKNRKLKKNKTKEIIEEEIIEEENQDIVSQKNEGPKYNYHVDETVDNKNKFQINADKITYEEENGNLYAKGHVEIIAKEQGICLKADDAVLDKSTQMLNLTGNVKVIKDGVEMKGETLKVDLNEQNILMDNPETQAFSFTIKAQEGYLIANDLQMLNGTIQSSKEQEIVLETSRYAQVEHATYEATKRRTSEIRDGISGSSRQKYTINAKEIVLTSYKDHNSILLKDADVYFNKHKIMRKTDFEFLSDKQRMVTEISSPEFGSLRNFGAYFGYGQVVRLPKGQILKIIPAITYKGGAGVGILGRYLTPNSRVEGGYSTSTETLVVSGQYSLGKGVSLRYARDTYMPEGFLGARRPGYGVQLGYEKSYKFKPLDIDFGNGIYAGFFSDYQKKDLEHAYSTTRFRYMANMRKKIFEIENKEHESSLTFSLQAQGAATVYGSGETTGIVRIGPTLSTKLKCWESAVGYFLSGAHGDSPFKFDKYAYGHSSIMLNEKIDISDKFSIGYRVYICPQRDNYNRDFLTESKLYAIVGPQDLKVAVSYDFIRERAFFNLMFILGSESSKINFEKLTTKNMDNANQKKDFYKKYNKTNIDI